MIKTKKANLRATPSSNGKIIAVLNEYDSVKILKAEGAWLKVKTLDGTGWVSKSVVEKLESKSAPAEKEATNFVDVEPDNSVNSDLIISNETDAVYSSKQNNTPTVVSSEKSGYEDGSIYKNNLNRDFKDNTNNKIKAIKEVSGNRFELNTDFSMLSVPFKYVYNDADINKSLNKINHGVRISNMGNIGNNFLLGVETGVQIGNSTTLLHGGDEIYYENLSLVQTYVIPMIIKCKYNVVNNDQTNIVVKAAVGSYGLGMKLRFQKDYYDTTDEDWDSEEYTKDFFKWRVGGEVGGEINYKVSESVRINLGAEIGFISRYKDNFAPDSGYVRFGGFVWGTNSGISVLF
jgi:hypothetical protein